MANRGMWPRFTLALALCLGLGCGGTVDDGSPPAATNAGKADELDDDGGGEADGDGDACPAATEVFPQKWPEGIDCDEESAIFVHRYDADTFILRQSLCTSFEGPFLHLLFGEDRVLLEDTGAGGVPVADAVFDVIDKVLAERGQESIELVVLNSHAHGDHVAGNGQFEGLDGVTVVGFTADELASFFEIDWPEGTGELDLGGRIVDVLPIPGHEDNHIALYDRNDQLLLTGDTMYPGRLFIDDFPTYEESIGRLVDFMDDHPTCWVLGTHIEMTQQPGKDFEFGSRQHENEHVLQLVPDHLRELAGALADQDDVPTQEPHADFIIFPL